MIDRFNNKENGKLALNLALVLLYEIIYLFVLMTSYKDYFFYYSNGYFIFFLVYLAFYIVFGRLFSAMNLGETTTTDLFLSHSLTLLFTDAFIYLILCLITLKILPLWPVLGMLAGQMAIAALYLYLANRYIKSSFPPVRLIAILGDSHSELIGKLNNVKDLSLQIVKTIELKKINYKKIDELLKGVDGVLTLDVHHENKKKIFKACYEKELLVYDVPSITDMLLASSQILHMVDTPILKTNDFGPSQVERIFKRLIDIFGSLVLLILTSPIMLLIAIAIKIEDHGDIFYKQTRLTTNGHRFEIIKFRSMIMNAEKHTGVTLAKENDDRITKVGAFIRKIRMDELPQLVDAWRQSNPRIVAFWWDVDRAAMEAVKYHHATKTHGILFTYRSGLLFITLPSGRNLAYVQPKVGTNKFGGECITYEGVGGTKKWERLDSYGPKFVENIVQATSRDILCYAMKTLRCCSIVMHIHDELVIEADPRMSLDAICEQMGRTPPWAKGLQLRADGYETGFYKKD